MVSINYATREVTCKIVYYGPGLSGKTTNLIYVHKKVPATSKGKMISLATEADRTLYFDFLPINIGSINGFAAKFQLYTVPGQVYYNATRKLVLRGADGLVFVADSQAEKMDENIESLTNLQENLEEYGYNIDEMPIVIQYNKRDLPGALSVDELNAKLNPRGWKSFEGEAVNGRGVFDTLKMIIKLVLEKAKSSRTTTGAAKSVPAPKPAQAPAESQPQAAATITPPPSQPTAVEANVTAPTDVQPSREAAYQAESGSPTAKTTSPSSEQPSLDPNVLSVDTEVSGTQDSAVSPVETTGDGEIANDAEDSMSRPFPGSTGKIPRRERRITVSDFQPASKDEDISALRSRLNDENEKLQQDEGSSMPSPSMAPSERVVKKKRGFFKRLFGVK